MTERASAIAVVRQMLEAARRRDVAAVTSCYANNAVAVSPLFGTITGADSIGANWAALFSSFSDLSVAVSNTLVDGNRVAMFATATTNDRGILGLPVTGGPITYRLILLFTVGDGKIIHEERIYDSTGVIDRLEKTRIDKELRMAADVQRALLSRTARVGAFCESVGDSLPCRAIGGDFFEFIEMPSGDVGVAMGGRCRQGTRRGPARRDAARENLDDEEFGEDRLIECLTAAASAPASGVLAQILSAVKTFSHEAEQTDDITVTVSRRRSEAN